MRHALYHHGILGTCIIWPMVMNTLPFRLLQGADNVLLDGVFHSMGKIGAREVSSRPWYGSEEVVDAWAAHLL